MKNVQKLVLVPIERWEKIGDKLSVKEVLVKSVPQKNISHHMNPVTPVKKVKLKNQKGLGKAPLQKKNLMFHFLPVEKRKKASKLFQYLTTHKIFRLTPDGEFIIKGKKVNDSNIVELITHAVDNISSEPIGMKYFYRKLKKNNVPNRYISNKIGKQIMNKSLSKETSTWRPPGWLNKNKLRKHE